MDTQPMVALPGTERPAPPGAVSVGPSPDTERIEITLLVRPSHPLDELEARLQQLGNSEPAVMSREAFQAEYGADPEAIARVSAFAQAHGLEILDVSAASRSVHLAGTVAEMSTAFGVALQQYRLPGGQMFRAHTGPVNVPASLSGVVQAVFGLDTRPQAQR